MTGSDLFYNGKKVAYCPYVVNWARKNGLLVSKAKAKKGDLAIFNFGGASRADHIGIIESNILKGRKFKTIEFNTSSDKKGSQSNGDGVWEKTRAGSLVSYVIRPKYTKEYTAENLVKIAKSQVGYKEGRNNDNKYGREYGYNHAPYCCQGVWWCFKHMKKVVSVRKEVPKVVKNQVKTVPKKVFFRKYKVIAIEGMNVRASYSTASKRVGGVKYRTVVRATRVKGNWIYVPKYKGWICVKSTNRVYMKRV